MLFLLLLALPVLSTLGYVEVRGIFSKFKFISDAMEIKCV